MKLCLLQPNRGPRHEARSTFAGAGRLFAAGHGRQGHRPRRRGGDPAGVDDTLTQGQAEGVTRCIVDNAQVSELQSLARDIGTVAGTSTLFTITAVATRPATLACIAEKGFPQPGFKS